MNTVNYLQFIALSYRLALDPVPAAISACSTTVPLCLRLRHSTLVGAATLARPLPTAELRRWSAIAPPSRHCRRY